MVITFRVFPDIQINTDLTRIVWLKKHFRGAKRQQECLSDAQSVLRISRIFNAEYSSVFWLLIFNTWHCHICSFEHGSYNLEKVLNCNSRIEKFLNSVKVLEKYLISLLGLQKSLKFSTLLTLHIFCEIRLFCHGKFGLSSV